MRRERWASRLGFITAAAGSAIGLANIWRFPYLVGQNGGAAFILVYLAFLALLGYPLLVAEVSIGRKGGKSPPGSLGSIAGNRNFWRRSGTLTILTGLLISSFYAVVAGWVIGYLACSLIGDIHMLSAASSAGAYFKRAISNPLWSVSYQLIFIALSTWVLLGGVRKGIEWVSRTLIPLLFLLLILFIIDGLWHDPTAHHLKFILTPDFSSLTAQGVLIALGQAFFTLSLGQGTMITYGSYLDKKSNIVSSCAMIVLFDTLAALLAAFAVFSIVGLSQASAASGPGLIFTVLPVAFSTLKGGYFLCVLFFLLIAIAALTSQISAMEPLICRLQEKGLSRAQAVLICALLTFALGLPSSLSFTYGWGFYNWITFFSLNILIPIGGLIAAVFVGWVWKTYPALQEVNLGLSIRRVQWLYTYFKWAWKYIAILLILVVFIQTLVQA